MFPNGEAGGTRVAFLGQHYKLVKQTWSTKYLVRKNAGLFRTQGNCQVVQYRLWSVFSVQIYSYSFIRFLKQASYVKIGHEERWKQYKYESL